MLAKSSFGVPCLFLSILQLDITGSVAYCLQEGFNVYQFLRHARRYYLVRLSYLCRRAVGIGYLGVIVTVIAYTQSVP